MNKTWPFLMDRLSGWIINDNAFFRYLDVIIFILILSAIYLSIQNILTWKFLKKEDSGEIFSNRGRFYKMLLFLVFTGFFMLIHKFLQGPGENLSDKTYHFFQPIALLGLGLFNFELYKMFKKLKGKQKSDIWQFTFL